MICVVAILNYSPLGIRFSFNSNQKPVYLEKPDATANLDFADTPEEMVDRAAAMLLVEMAAKAVMAHMGNLLEKVEMVETQEPVMHQVVQGDKVEMASQEVLAEMEEMEAGSVTEAREVMVVLASTEKEEKAEAEEMAETTDPEGKVETVVLEVPVEKGEHQVLTDQITTALLCLLEMMVPQFLPLVLLPTLFYLHFLLMILQVVAAAILA